MRRIDKIIIAGTLSAIAIFWVTVRATGSNVLPEWQLAILPLAVIVLVRLITRLNSKNGS